MNTVKEMENKINWNLVEDYASRDKLGELLEDSKFSPPSCWNEQDANGWCLLHYSVYQKFSGKFTYNVKAVLILIKAGCNVNLKTNYDSTPVHFACKTNDSTILSMLCSAGADLRIKSVNGEPRYLASSNCLKILLANGVRLRHMYCTQDFIDFEQGVIQCRDVIVTLLGLKKFRGVAMLSKLDRFLIKQELAVSIWSTRYSM